MSVSNEVLGALKPEGHTVIVCIGNSLRGDDGVGPFLAERIVPPSPDVSVINAFTAFESVVQKIIDLKPDKVIIIDAADFGGRPGEIREISASRIARYFMMSTHNLPIKLTLDIIRQDTNAEIRLIGVQAKSMSLSEKLSPEVEKSANEIINYYSRLTGKAD